MSSAAQKSVESSQTAAVRKPAAERQAVREAGRAGGSAEALLALQHSAGNRAVTELLRGSAGRPLDRGTRREMEVKFGADFGDVRVHTGRSASDSAFALGANAWTAGEEVTFGDGLFAPGTSAGKKLLAHELAHVVQQRRGGTTPRTFDSSSAAERDAATAAAQITSTGSVAVSAATGAGVARDESERPWWKQQLNPMYQKALEVLPKGAADKLREANAAAKDFVQKSGVGDEQLNKAVHAAEPVLRPLADALGVKESAASGVQPAGSGDAHEVTPQGEAPARGDSHDGQSRTDSMVSPELRASLDAVVPPIPQSPQPPPKAHTGEQGVADDVAKITAPPVKDGPQGFQWNVKDDQAGAAPKTEIPQPGASADREQGKPIEWDERRRLAKGIEEMGGISYDTDKVPYEVLQREYRRLQEKSFQTQDKGKSPAAHKLNVPSDWRRRYIRVHLRGVDPDNPISSEIREVWATADEAEQMVQDDENEFAGRAASTALMTMGEAAARGSSGPGPGTHAEMPHGAAVEAPLPHVSTEGVVAEHAPSAPAPPVAEHAPAPSGPTPSVVDHAPVAAAAVPPVVAEAPATVPPSSTAAPGALPKPSQRTPMGHAAPMAEPSLEASGNAQRDTNKAPASPSEIEQKHWKYRRISSERPFSADFGKPTGEHAEIEAPGAGPSAPAHDPGTRPEMLPENQDQPPAKDPTAKPHAELPSQSSEEMEASARRPKLSKKTILKVWENAVKASKDGIVRDPVTGEVLSSPYLYKGKLVVDWEMGHLPGREYWRLHQMYKKGLLGRPAPAWKKVTKYYNDPEHYRPESRETNRSHDEEDVSAWDINGKPIRKKN